jgi:hypothetical protein
MPRSQLPRNAKPVYSLRCAVIARHSRPLLDGMLRIVATVEKPDAWPAAAQ